MAASSDVVLDPGFIVDFIALTVDPSEIYAGLAVVTGLLSLAPWFILLFTAVRIFRESLDSLSGKAAIAQAFGDSSKMLIMLLAYGSGGFLLFSVMFGFSEIFKSFGSTELIHGNLLSLRAELMSPKEYEGWVSSTLGYTSDLLLGFTGTPIVFGLYSMFQVVYVFFSQFINIIFAIGVAITYAWGFIAIPTMTLKGDGNLMGGFKHTYVALFIWVLLEPILLFFVWVVGKATGVLLVDMWGGAGMGVTGMTAWYAFANLTMFTVLVVKIMAPFLAHALAKNDSMVNTLGAGTAIPATIAMNQVAKKVFGNNGLVGQGINSMMPNSEGNRTRDGIFKSASDLMRSTPGDAFRATKSGLGGIAERFSSGGSTAGDSVTANTSGSPDASSASTNSTSSLDTETSSENTKASNSGSSNDLSADPATTDSPTGSTSNSQSNDLSSVPDNSNNSPSKPGTTDPGGKK